MREREQEGGLAMTEKEVSQELESYYLRESHKQR